MSAIERAAVARTSTRVSSISRMIIRIIRAGSSARSRSPAMFAAKMSRARLNTGPLSQPATGAKRPLFGSVSTPIRRGVRTGTLASRISRSGSDADLHGVGIGLRRTDGRADRDGAQDERRCDGNQAASERRLGRHLTSPFRDPPVWLRADEHY